MASGDTKTEAMLNALGNGGSADEFRGCCNTKTQQYILDAIDRVQNVEDEVEELKNNPDVVDIVDTYADLQAYDTQHLTENDIIRVLQDETHDDNSTYYRFTKNPDTWTFIGEISGGSSVNIVQTTGVSTTDVMSQNATTNMVFADAGTNKQIQIGDQSSAPGDMSVAIGYKTDARKNSVAIGNQAKGGTSNTHLDGIAIGVTAKTSANGAISLGAYSQATQQGEMNIGTTQTSDGYDNSNYRLISGVHDPVNAHDAATKGYVDANAGGVTTLTSADYDYPTYSPSSIAVWNLPGGFYRVGAKNVTLNFDTGTSLIPDTGFSFIVEPNSYSDETQIIILSSYLKVYRTRTSNGYTKGVEKVVNDLTSTSISSPLSAKQGKVLKTLIDSLIQAGDSAPTTSTVGTLGQLYIDKTNMHTYQCTAISGDTYTWTQRW